MIIESFLTQIAVAVMKKAIVGTAVESLVTAYEVYSAVDSLIELSGIITTTNDSRELGVSGVKVVSDSLGSVLANQIVEYGSHMFVVEQRKSGVYIASRLTHTFRTDMSFPKPARLQRGEFPRPSRVP